MVISIRHLMFDSHLLKSHKFDTPVICVGNITVGGTGKTPTAEMIVSYMKQYYNVALLSRGYGRRTKGYIEVDSNSYRVDILKLFINAGKKIQWTPLFRERNGKLSCSHIAKYGKVFFYVDYTEELINWLRERKQAI